MLLAGYEVFRWFTHVYEDDARIRAELTNISAEVNGRIEHILVEEGSRVAAGQELVRLVDDEIRLGLAALRTDLTLKKAETRRLTAEKSAFEAELASKLNTQKQKIRAIETQHTAIKERLALSEKNLARVAYLFERNIAPEEKFAAEKDKVLILRSERTRVGADIAVARSEYEQLESAVGQVTVFLEKIRVSEIEQTRIADHIRLQEAALAQRVILSPIDGVIGRVHRYGGEYVEDGVTILMLHDPERFWLEAYVDEGQLRHVREGQAVLIEFESYPFQDFHGTVSRIGNVTAAEMGLMMPGANGRFGSGTERVAVRIALDNPPPNLTPGMRASVNIRIYEEIRLW